jgi:transposase
MCKQNVVSMALSRTMGNRFKRQAKRKERAKQKKQGLLQVKASSKDSIPPLEVPKDDTDQRTEVSLSELEAIIARTENAPLGEQDRHLLLSAAQTLRFLTAELEKKGISVARLKKLLFGAATETSKNLGLDTPDQDEADSQTDKDNEQSSEPKKKRKGHGRNGADAYTGAKKVQVPHETLRPGDLCPDCVKGTVYETSEPGTVVCVTGRAPLDATVYELQKLRCNLCGKIFTAEAPAEAAQDAKYDAEAGSMVALLKYGTGMPFNRLEGLQRSLGIPLPAGTQWDILKKVRPFCAPVHEYLTVEAAQGDVLHNDDTPMLIREHGPVGQDETSDSNASERTGQFTSGIVSILGDNKIALYFTGNKHAGENLAKVLQHRAEELAEPIQMCDALSRNVPKDFKTIVGNCLVHGRRNFADIIQFFPSECEHVIKQIGTIYKNNDITRKEQMSALERLQYHQQHSGPIMETLKEWLNQQFDDKKVEPNSALGGAIQYMLNHWKKLTLFLREPDAPLDNNICERALKKAILHRKNAYFYKNANGAAMGDMFMSLIHTCELNGVNPFDYLTALQKHARAVAVSPGDWLPWNYQDVLPTEHMSPVTLA